MPYQGNLNATPNPFVDFINISFNATTSGQSKLYVFDINNREITSIDFEGKGRKCGKVQFGAIPNGTYILQVHFKGVKYSKLLIKQ